MPNFEYLYGPALNLWLNSSDSNTLFTTARRKQAINDAHAQFCDLTDCLQRQSTVTLSCNTVEYNLNASTVLGSTDFARLSKQGVEYKLTSSAGTVTTWLTGDDFPQRPIEWRNREESGWRQSTTPTQPSGYYLRNDGGQVFLGLDARPDVGSSETAVLIVPFIARPAEMTSSGDLPFTVGSNVRTDLSIFHDALPHYAAYQLLPLTGDDQGAQAHLQRFLDYVTRYLQQTRPKGGSYAQMGLNYLRRARRMPSGATVPPSQFS